MARRKKRDPISAIFQQKHPYLPGTEILRQLDIDHLAEELDVDAQGAKDGADEVPPADGKTLALKEREIVGRLRQLWDETVEGAKRAYEGYRGRYASYTADTEIDSLLAEPGAVAVELREAAREDRARLTQDWEAVRLACADLTAFREREGITHAPRPSQKQAWKIAIIGVAALFEFLVNAAIFANGDAGGIFGAVLKVFVIPIANIGGAWLLTHWLARHVLSRSLILKAIGGLGCALALSWLLGLNLWVAHWREAAEAVLSADAVKASYESAVTHPFALHSYESWGLFLIGCAAGIVAIYEGWAWKEPHPGYGRRADHAQQLLDTWWALRREAIQRLDEIRQTNTERLADAQRRAEIAIAERPNIASAVQSLSEDLRLYADHMRYICEELGARYREANFRVRKGERPPQFDRPLVLALEVPALQMLDAGANHRPVAGRLSAAIEKITEAYSEACAVIPSADELQQDGAAT